MSPVGQSWMQTFPATGFWSISLTSGQTRTGVNFGNIRPSSVAGGKFEDLNGNGVQDAGDPGTGGFTIQLINPASNFRLRVPPGFRSLFPCVSGRPAVAGAHHDWSGTPPDWNGDAGFARFPVGPSGCHDASQGILQS